MSPYPSVSSSFASPTPTSASQTSDATPKNDPRLRATIIVLVIVAAFLISYIMYITVRLKRQQDNGEIHEPQGTIMHQDHPAAHIIPFGAVGPEVRGNVPQFKHRPGEDMRIALRRPDGAWHFTDSRTPFTPAGVSDIDVVPSPISASVGFFSPTAHLLSSKKEGVANASRFVHSHHQPPPPVYYREPCKEHFDDSQLSPH